MSRWRRYWERRPTQYGSTEYLKQVGHTEGGQPYSPERFDAMISGIVSLLELRPGDRLLDLACGNGVITARLAAQCQDVVGVDFSTPLLAIANRDHRPANVRYQRLDLRDLGKLPHPHAFTKVVMYGALQHFEKRQFRPMVSAIAGLTSEDRRILIGGIPDRARKNAFYQSRAQRVSGAFRSLAGRNPMGTWWDRRFLERTLDELGLRWRIEDSDPTRPGALYRFDLLIW